MGSTYEHHRHDETENKEVRGKRKTGRRQWCRGKVGAEHKFTTGIPKNYYSNHKGCTWHGGWSRKYRKFVPDAYWACIEAEYCEVCGKVNRPSIGNECTQFTGDKTQVTFGFMAWLRSYEERN